MKNKAKIKQRCVAEIRQALSRIRPDGGGFGGGAEMEKQEEGGSNSIILKKSF